MTDAWEERKKALENKYFHDLEKELIEKIQVRQNIWLQLLGVLITQKDGRTPLHLAVFRAHREMAALLLENGADIWVEDLRGRTPFHLARISADTTLLALMVPPEVLRPGSAADRPAAAEWFARGHSLAVVGNYPQAIQAIDPQAAAGLGAPRP